MDENHLIPSFLFVQARTEMDDKCAEYEDKISALRQELRQKERKLQTELAEQVKFSLSLRWPTAAADFLPCLGFLFLLLFGVLLFFSKDALVSNAESRTRKLQSALEAKEFELKAKQTLVEDRDGEIAKLHSRLRHQETTSQEDKTRTEKNIAELQRYLQVRTRLGGNATD